MNDSPATSRRADTRAVLFALVFPTVLTLLYFVLLAGQATGIQQAVYTVGKCVQFGFPLVWVLAFQRRRLRLEAPQAAGLPEGVAFGVVVLAAMLLLYHTWLKSTACFTAAGPEICAKITGLGLDSLPRYVAFGLFVSLAHSLLEEYYWRWFVFGQLSRLVSLRTAVIISSLGFMAHHVLILKTYFGLFSLATLLFSLGIAVGGAVWAWLYHRTNSLYGPWLSHLLVDGAIFLIGYDLAAHLFAS